MPDILHRIAIKSSPASTYEALTAQKKLAGWWTTDTSGGFDVDGVIAFRFGTRGHIDMKVAALEPQRRVVWEVTDGPDEWAGTSASFELAPDGDYTVVLFKHRNWAKATDFMHHCSTKWATFLLSLKAFVETGRGAPYPDDVRIGSKGD